MRPQIRSGHVFLSIALAFLFWNVPLLADPGDHPILIFPGWGSSLVESWSEYVSRLEADGFPADRIHVLHYAFRADLSTIDSELMAQLEPILSKYPSETTFDVHSHSMGQFVGLYTFVRHDLTSRIHKFVGISGIAHGLNMNLCGVALPCGRAILRLIPYESAFVQAFYRDHQASVSAISKCSLFSPEDGFIKPYDSGAFDDGVNISVPNMKHRAAIHGQEHYDAMKTGCYPDGW